MKASSSLSVEKEALRREMKRRNASFASADKALLSERICDRFLATYYDQMPVEGWTLLYHSLPDEVNVVPLLQILHQRGRGVLLPKVVGKELELRVYEGEHSLRPGPFGILEPQGELIAPSLYGSIHTALVPGLAFDLHGGRLGRGGGYYDRLLPMLHAQTIGGCFPFQIVDQVPRDSLFDYPVQDVLTVAL